MTTEVRETRARFWTNIPSWRREGRRRGGTRRRGTRLSSGWCATAEIRPRCSRELTFEREFSTNARPFTRAMEAIETWVATSLRRLEERFPGRSAATDGGRDRARLELLAIDEEEYERTFACKDDARASIALRSCDTALMHDFLASFRARRRRRGERRRASGFALERFRALPLEVLPPEHFVLGIYSGVSHASSSLTSSNAASTERFHPGGSSVDRAVFDHPGASGSSSTTKRTTRARAAR